MIEVSFKDPSTCIARGDPITLLGWRRQHAIEIEGARYSPAFKKGWSDAKYYPGYRFEIDGVLRFRRGLLPMLCQDLPCVIIDEPHPEVLPTFGDLDLTGLRDYQYKALVTLGIERWGRFAMATNAGKGAIIALFAQAASKSGLKSLICCDELEVYHALFEEIRGWGDPNEVISEIKEGTKEPPVFTTNITLAMVPTLARRLKKPKKENENWQWWMEWMACQDVLLMDEADKATAATWERILTAATHSYWRAGFSGTFPEPGSLNDLKLEETLGPILARIENVELVERGISAKPTVRLCPYKATLPKRPEGWSTKVSEGGMTGGEKRRWIYEQAVSLNTERHYFIKGLLDLEGHNIIVVRYIQHGIWLSQVVECPFIYGDSSEQERNSVLNSFAAGGMPTIVVTSILDRGSNRMGKATNIIFASGEGSDTQTLQRIGRGLRRDGGKAEVMITDIVDQAHRYLKVMARKRVNLYHSQGFETSIVDYAEV